MAPPRGTRPDAAHVPALAVRGLTVAITDRRGDTRAVVDDVDLTVARGEIVALVGESGSGKSLTARAALGLLPERARASGSITVAGTEVVGADEATLRSVRGARAAMVFQEPQTALNPVQTIGTQLRTALGAHESRPARGRRARAEVRRRSIELLRRVELPDPEARLSWYPHQLSGGQKQRVVLALALASEPDVLLADEPTTALDVTVQAEILALVRSLAAGGGTAVLLITHNMGVVADSADRVVVMRAGRVVETGEVHALFAAPKTDYTRTLLASVPRLPAAAPDPVRTAAPIAETTGTDTDTRAGDTPAAVTFEAVTRTYGEFTAVDDVTLTVAPGEVLGIVGESGSGKTTLGRIALGLERPSSGRVLLGGVDPSTVSRRDLASLRRGIALVHQDPAAALDPRWSIARSVAEPLVVHRDATGSLARERALTMLDAVGLPRHFGARRPAELSGGQRQRVALARALVLRPTLVVADEPTSALDVSVQADVLDLFEDLRAEYGFACLFIAHDLAVVHRIADRVAVMRHGRVVEHDDAATVLGAPTHPYTAALVDAVPPPDPVSARTRRTHRIVPATPA
ncbi:ABC peptide transporter [Rhodococcus rhodnii LMG 5362]|uniref:ABC peptide transporter n=1 Tax=Rhodococcus rhodnii LMG 5362 TaxID=1273125 RepID=R7WT07_9NOCA|nr:ABC peptide transporter [Rhodococcus rhodnii LMG 5362]